MKCLFFLVFTLHCIQDSMGLTWRKSVREHCYLLGLDFLCSWVDFFSQKLPTSQINNPLEFLPSKFSRYVQIHLNPRVKLPYSQAWSSIKIYCHMKIKQFQLENKHLDPWNLYGYPVDGFEVETETQLALGTQMPSTPCVSFLVQVSFCFHFFKNER